MMRPDILAFSVGNLNAMLNLVKCPKMLREHHADPGPRLNIKTVLSTYGDFHVKDKTAVRTSYL